MRFDIKSLAKSSQFSPLGGAFSLCLSMYLSVWPLQGGESPNPPGSCDLPLLSHWLSGLVGLFEGFEERGVLGNDMILERGQQQQQQHQQKQLNKTTTTTTTTTTTNRVLGGWSVQQGRSVAVWCGVKKRASRAAAPQQQRGAGLN